MENKKLAPSYLTHKPVVTVDYEKIDSNAGDAKFLSLGHATWNYEDYSAKIFRWAEDSERWSRQSEELPLWRVLDLAILVAATINKKNSYLQEFVQDDKSINDLRDYLQENMELLAPKLTELKRLLSSNIKISSNSCEPNIFDFATSELSQDAMFAWLIQWADPTYKSKDVNLHKIAQDFVRLLIGKKDFEIKSISVGRQWENIDIWVEINDDAFLVIEDKTNTSIHDNQLLRYKETVKQEYKGKRGKLFFSYIKTGNEPMSVLSEIANCGYRCIQRLDIIQCIEKYTGNNEIILDYLKHLQDLESSTQSYKTLPVSEWGWYAWQGFYKDLEKRLDLTSWNYVANPSGGFLGAWWYFTPFATYDGEMYLQFEEEKLCFKICYEGKRKVSEVRVEQFEKLISIAQKLHHEEITKPSRFGAGKCMTLAIVDPQYLFGNGVIDMEGIVKKLLAYQEMIELCCEK